MIIKSIYLRVQITLYVVVLAMIGISYLFDEYILLFMAALLVIAFTAKNSIQAVEVQTHKVIFYSVRFFKKKKQVFLRAEICSELTNEVTFRGGKEEIILLKEVISDRKIFRLGDKDFESQDFMNLKALFLSEKN